MEKTEMSAIYENYLFQGSNAQQMLEKKTKPN